MANKVRTIMRGEIAIRMKEAGPDTVEVNFLGFMGGRWVRLGPAEMWDREAFFKEYEIDQRKEVEII